MPIIPRVDNSLGEILENMANKITNKMTVNNTVL